MNPLVIWNGLIAICTVATTLYATQRMGTNVVPKYQSLGPPTNQTIGFTPSLDGNYLLDGPSYGLIDQPDSLGGFRPSNVSAELCLVEPMVDPGTLNHTSLVFLQGLIEPSSSDNSILQKQEPTVANPLDQDKHDALTTQLEAIDVVRKDAETAVESVDTQVEEAQSLQELKATENNISDKITTDPETGVEKAQNAVYQAALSTVGDKIEIFETNQQALNTAISELLRIPEQSEKPLSLTEQNERIEALEQAIKSVDTAKQKPGVQLDNEQSQEIQAQEKRLESLRSTYSQGLQAVKNIRDLTVVDKIGVMTSSDSPKLVDVVNDHNTVVKRLKKLQSSETQAAIGLDSDLGQPVKQAINTLEDDYVKLRMEAYKNELTKIQDSGPHSNLLQQVGKALKQAINSIVPGPDKENTSDLIKIKISQLDNEIQAVNAKIQAIQELTIHSQYDDILTKRSATNLTDESNQESSVPLSGQLAELREQFIAPLKILKGTLRAQQFEAGLSKPEDADSDSNALEKWVPLVETIQSQFEPGMRVDDDETITQGFQEQLSNTLAVYTQPLSKAYTNLATDNEGLINSATRVASIREMTLPKLETAQADLKLMQKALALKNKGVPILNFNATQLDDALNAVGVAIDVQREYSEMLQKIEESVPKNRDLSSKELLTNIQYIKSKYVDSIFEKFKNAQLTQGDKLQGQLQQKIAAYQDNLVSQYIGTLGDAPRIDVKAWLSGLVDVDVEPADIFTEKQVELLEDFKGSLDRIPLQLKKSVGWPHSDNSKFQPYAIDQLSADQLDTILSKLNNISSDQIVDSMKSISELSQNQTSTTAELPQNQTSTYTQLTKKLYDNAVADLKGQVSRQLAQINNVKLEDINGQLMNQSQAFDNLLERNVNETTPLKDLTAYISELQDIKQAVDNIAAPQGSDQATTKSTLERKIEEASGEAKQIEATLQSRKQDEKNQDAEKELPLKLLRSILNIDGKVTPSIETFNLSQCQDTLDRLKAMDRQTFFNGLNPISTLAKILDGDKGDEIFKGAQASLKSSLDKQIRIIESKKDKSKDIVKQRAKQGFENKLSQIRPSNALERLKEVMDLHISPGVESLTISRDDQGAYNSALRYLDDNGSSSENIVGEVRKACIAEVLLKGLPDAINALGNIENMKLGEVKHALDELQTISRMVDEKQLEWLDPSFKENIIKAQDELSLRQQTLKGEETSDSEQDMDVQVATENTSQELTNGSNVQERAATKSHDPKNIREIISGELVARKSDQLQQCAKLFQKAVSSHFVFLVQNGLARVEFLKNHAASPASEDRVVALINEKGSASQLESISRSPLATYLNPSTESIGTMQIFVAKQVLLSQGGGPNSSDTWAMFMRIDLVSQGAGPIYARLSMMASDFKNNWVSLVMDFDSSHTKDLLTVMQLVDPESASAVSTLQLYNKVAGQVNGESVGLEQLANTSPPDALQAIENPANRVGDRETSRSSLSTDNSLVVACQNAQEAEHLLNNPSRAITDTPAVQTGSVSSNQPDQALLQKVLGRMTSNFQGVSYPDMQSLIGRLPDDTRRFILSFISDGNGTISLKKLDRFLNGGSNSDRGAIAYSIPAELRQPLLDNMSSNSTTVGGGREVSAGAYPINPLDFLLLAMLTAKDVKSALSRLLRNTAPNANNQVSLIANGAQNQGGVGSGSEGVPDTSSDTEALAPGQGRVICTHQNRAITKTTYKLDDNKLEEIETVMTKSPGDDGPEGPVVAVNASWDPDRASDMAYVVTYQAVDAFFKGNTKDQLVLSSLDYDQAENIYKAIDDCIKSYEQGDPNFRKERVSPDLLKNLRKNLPQQSHESSRLERLDDLQGKVKKFKARQTSSGNHGKGNDEDDPKYENPGSNSLTK